MIPRGFLDRKRIQEDRGSIDEKEEKVVLIKDNLDLMKQAVEKMEG